MARHKFSVDQYSKDDVCDRSIEQLKKVVELGLQAQTALDSIKSIGYFDGVAPVVMSVDTTDLYHNGKGVEGHSVRFAILQKRLGFSRADLPPLDNLKLIFGKPEEASYGGHDCIEVPLWCEGTVARQVDELGKLAFFEEKSCMGEIRINKHHLSYVNSVTRATVQVFSKLTTDKAKYSAKMFAKRLAEHIVDIGNYENSTKDSGRDLVPMAARTLDLQEAAPDWFVEDGVVERMWKEIHDMIAVMRVMEA